MTDKDTISYEDLDFSFDFNIDHHPVSTRDNTLDQDPNRNINYQIGTLDDFVVSYCYECKDKTDRISIST